MPARLRKALERRGVCLQECSDPHAAMTTLCLLARRVGRRLSGARLILLVIEPQRQRQLNEFLRAVEQYVPGVTCRAYREDGAVTIVPLETNHARDEAADLSAPAAATTREQEADRSPAEQHRTSPPAPPYPQGEGAARPQLRLTAIDDCPDEGNAAAPERRETSPEPLTAEELSMLLADDEDDVEAQER